MGNYDIKLMIKVAELYYMDNLPQRDIAQRLSLSRPKVSRLLKAARENNIVQIKINYPKLMRSELEKTFEEKYKLMEAIIINNEGLDDNRSLIDVSTAAADYLKSVVRDNDYIGVAWGRTLNTMVEAMGINKINGIKVVQIIGSLGQNIISSSEIVRKMAETFQGEYYLLPAPGFVSNPEIKNAIIKDGIIQEVLNTANKLNVVVIGIGQIDQDSNPFYKSYLTQKDLELVKKRKIVGEICGHFFDANGNFDASLSERAISMSVEDFKRVPRVIAVALGDEKIMAIKGALNTGIIDVLITDKKTAKKVLE